MQHRHTSIKLLSPGITEATKMRKKLDKRKANSLEFKGKLYCPRCGPMITATLGSPFTTVVPVKTLTDQTYPHKTLADLAMCQCMVWAAMAAPAIYCQWNSPGNPYTGNRAVGRKPSISAGKVMGGSQRCPWDPMPLSWTNKHPSADASKTLGTDLSRDHRSAEEATKYVFTHLSQSAILAWS